MHKIGACLVGKLTICIDNAGPLQGHCIVAELESFLTILKFVDSCLQVSDIGKKGI